MRFYFLNKIDGALSILLIGYFFAPVLIFFLFWCVVSSHDYWTKCLKSVWAVSFVFHF